jgi:hypothetical protein
MIQAAKIIGTGLATIGLIVTGAGIGVVFGMLTLLLKFYIFSIGIFIGCSLIYFTLLKCLNILHKNSKLFEIVFFIFNLLLLFLLLCLMYYSFPAFILLFQIFYLSIFGIFTYRYLYDKFIIFKIEYPNMYKILCKFIFYLFIIILAIILFFIYLKLEVEIPVEYLVVENKIRIGNFMAFSPTESNAVEEYASINLTNIMNLYRAEDASFRALYSQQIAEVTKFHNTWEIERIECERGKALVEAVSPTMDLPPLKPQADNDMFSFHFKNELSAQDMHNTYIRITVNVDQITNLSGILSKKLDTLKALDIEQARITGSRKYTDIFYEDIGLYLSKCEKRFTFFRLSGKPMWIHED